MIRRSDLMRFDNAVVGFTANVAPERHTQIHRAVHLEGLRRVVLKTPVEAGIYDEDGDLRRKPQDPGRARGGWQSTIGAPASGQSKSRDTNGGSTIANGAAVVAKIPEFSDSWITNNLPDIEVLENGGYPDPPKDPGYNVSGERLTVGGYSRQAPQGMMKVTVEELRSVFGG